MYVVHAYVVTIIECSAEVILNSHQHMGNYRKVYQCHLCSGWKNTAGRKENDVIHVYHAQICS